MYKETTILKLLRAAEKEFRYFFPRKLKKYKEFRALLKDKRGIEIGGPSQSFDSKGFLPLYDIIESLDGCNFSSNTVWEGSINEGLNYKFGIKKGYQYISDGTNLMNIKDETYDFVLSCHSLEHFANPLKAIQEWKRIIKKDGYLVIVIPHKDKTFDHKRPVTTIDHLIEDYKNNTPESDETHFEEINSLHDLSRDRSAKINNIEMLKQRTKDNFNNRCAHQHVFNTPLLVKIANYMNLEINYIQLCKPFHIVAMLKKSELILPNNNFYLSPNNPIYHNKNFPSDLIW